MLVPAHSSRIMAVAKIFIFFNNQKTGASSMSIRPLITHRLGLKFSRNIYLHKGPRVSGLKKHPELVFITKEGIKHEPSPKNLQYIKAFLEDKYQIPDDMILQVLTHKSFGNGIKPYNEKLSAMGSKIVNLFFAKYCIEGNNNNNENSINGKNLDVLGSPIAKELGGRLSLGIFAKTYKLNSIMFWNSYNYDLNFESSGELKVSAQMMYALIGAVNFIHGKAVSEQFIRQKLIDMKPSVEDITKTIIEQQ